jgi:ABC-type oligopeptide transport system substrate-binding subunit
MELERNPRFRGKTFPANVDPIYQLDAQVYKDKAMPYLDGIRVFLSGEAQTGWLQFMQANVDILELMKDQAVEFIQGDGTLSPELAQKNIRLGATIPKDNVYYLGINNRHPLLQDKRLRQAMALSIDRQRMIDLFYPNRAQLAHGLVPPAALPINTTTAPLERPDLERAKKLAQAALKDHVQKDPLVLLVRNTVEGRMIGEFLVAQLGQIGLKVVVETLPITSVIDRARKGDYGLFYLAWFVGLPSPVEFFELLYGPNYPDSWNRIGFVNKQYDATFERLRLNHSDHASIQKLEEILKAEMPVVPLFHVSTQFLYHPWVKNYVPSEMFFGVEQYFDLVR